MSFKSKLFCCFYCHGSIAARLMTSAVTTAVASSWILASLLETATYSTTIHDADVRNSPVSDWTHAHIRVYSTDYKTVAYCSTA